MAISSSLGSSALLPAGLGFRNVIINGAMQVAQRSSSVSGIAGAIAQQYYTADRYATTILGTAGTWTQSVADTADDYPIGSGFRKSLKMTCTTATTPIGANGLCAVNQRIEGQNLQAIRKGTSSAQTMYLSFWVKSGIVGTYISTFYDFPNARQVCKAYTINVANTWEYKTLLIPADTAGVLNNDNTAGFQVSFYLAAGSNYSSGTLQTTWGAYVAANECVGQVNVASGNNSAVNYWQITGIQLEANLQPTPFEQRPIGVELALCQRYYFAHANDGATYIDLSARHASDIYRVAAFYTPVPMRKKLESGNIALTISSGSPFYDTFTNRSFRVGVNAGNTSSEIWSTGWSASAEL